MQNKSYIPKQIQFFNWKEYLMKLVIDKIDYEFDQLIASIRLISNEVRYSGTYLLISFSNAEI